MNGPACVGGLRFRLLLASLLFIVFFSAAGWGILVRLSSPEVFLEDGTRFTVFDSLLISIGGFEVGPKFSQLLPNFSLFSKEQEWWRCQEIVGGLLLGREQIELVYSVGEGGRYEQLATVRFPTSLELLRGVWVAYLAGGLLVLGAYAVLTRHWNEVGVVVGVFFLSFALWVILLCPVATRSIILERGHFQWLVLSLYSVIGGCWSLFHLSLIFPQRWRIVERHPWLPYVGYGLAMVEIVLYASGRIAYGATYWQAVIAAIVITAFMIRSLWKESDRFIRYQATLFVVLPLLGVAAMVHVCFMIADQFGGPWMSFNALALMFMVLPFSLVCSLDNIRLYRERISIERSRAKDRAARLELEKRSLVEQQRFRNEIRADLHDSVFSRLAVVSRYLDLARQRLKHPESRREVDGFLNEQIEALGRLRVRGMDLSDISKEQPFTPDHLFELIENAMDKLLGWAGIETCFRFEHCLSEESRLQGRLCSSLFFVFREIATNCVRHSGAKRFRAVLTIDEKEVRGETSDDGVGFPPDVLEEPAEIGRGVASMNWRFEQLNGELIRMNGVNGGAMIRFSFPTQFKGRSDGMEVGFRDG